MLNRSTYIVSLILLWGQILLAGFIPGPTLGPLHPAWLLQDRLVAQIDDAARCPWPFGFRRCTRRRSRKRHGLQRPASSQDQEEAVESETAQSPEAQPDPHPQGKSPETIEPVPEMNLEPQDIDCLLNELGEYHAIYSPLFYRREQRERSGAYLNGLLLDIPDKAIEPMILALEGADPNAIRGMQHFISEGVWGDEAILKRHWQEVDQYLGDEDGVHILDGSDFPKQGEHSVGVKRQYCGQLGKVANCQAGVFLGYTSRKGYTLLDRRLYLPKEWVEDDAYAERRQKCGVPKDIEFKTKPELGWEMIQAVREEGTLRGRWLTCDEDFGRDPSFLDKVNGIELWYYAEVPHDTRVWLERPATAVPEWSGRRRKPTRERLVEGEPPAQEVTAIAQSWPADQWSRHTIKEGSKGPLVADFAALRVVAVRDGLPGPEVWLVLRRDVVNGELKTYLSNAAADTPLETLVRLSGMRWPIETCFEGGKQHLGMGDYQVRSWRGWHHHMTLCILAHFFLVRIKLKLKENAPALTLPQIHLLLTGVLPKRQLDAQWVLEVVAYRQERNHAAYLSHRKRRLALLNQLE
jgi:SRSO17 transposase